MSLTAALSTALTGLQVASRNLDVASNNIANVETPGFSRKRLDQETLVLDGQGRGVRGEEVTRIADAFLNKEVREQKGERNRRYELESYLERAQSEIFGAPGEPERGLPARLGKLGEALQTFAAQPEKIAARQHLLGTLADLAQEIDRAGERVQELRAQADRRIGETVQEINRILRSLHELNADFAVSGGTPELLDERDRLLEQLAGKLDITVVENERDTISVYARGGIALLEHAPRVLVYTPASQVTADTAFDAIEVYDLDQIDADSGKPLPGENGEILVSAGTSPATTLTSGTLVGLLEVRDDRLTDLADQLDEFAGLLRFAVNRAHNRASAVPPPQSLTGTNDSAASTFDAATRSGTAHVAVVDTSTGAVVDVVTLDLATIPDTATLVSTLDGTLSSYGGGATLSGDGPLALSVGAGYGIAISEGTSAIQVTDAAGHTREYGFSHYFGLNDLLVTTEDRTTALAVRDVIADDAQLLAGATLAVDSSTSPPTATLGGIGDNRGARELLDALDAEYATVAQGGLPARNASATTYLEDLVAYQAGELSRLRESREVADALVEDLEARRSAVSGVDLDEELSKLVVYQQAYAASAQIMRVTNELFDELLAIAR